MDEILKRDENHQPVAGFVTDDSNEYIRMARIDDTTKGLKVLVVGGSLGTVSTVSVVTANGVSGTVANATTTPAITLALGVITPTSVNGLTLASQAIGFTIAGGTTSKTLTVPLDASVSGTNTGDQTNITGNAGTVTNGVYTTSQVTALAAVTNAGDKGKYLYNDPTTGVLSWSTVAGGGATVALDNLNTVAINTALLPGTAGALDFGSTTKPWASLWLAGTSGTPGTNQFKLTGASTGGLRTITLPDNSGTVIITDQAVGQTIGATGARLTKLWATDIESTNAPTVGGVVVPTISSTNTLTNKRITPRILTAASYTTDTGTSINGDTLDMFIVTAQAGALKFNNPSGTPTDGQKLIISVASSTTSARALTWDTAYGATTVALPTTTAATTATLTIGFIWSASKSLWQCVAVA